MLINVSLYYSSERLRPIQMFLWMTTCIMWAIKGLIYLPCSKIYKLHLSADNWLKEYLSWESSFDFIYLYLLTISTENKRDLKDHLVSVCFLDWELIPKRLINLANLTQKIRLSCLFWILSHVNHRICFFKSIFVELLSPLSSLIFIVKCLLATCYVLSYVYWELRFKDE